MSGKLFGNNIPPACKYCIEAMQLFGGGKKVLCEHKGVVPADYKCRNYFYDPLKREPKRLPSLQKYTSEDFSL